MSNFQNNGTTLVTGGSGYLGGLIIESLLRETQQNLLILARNGQQLKTIIEPVRIERISRGEVLTSQEIERISILNYPSIESLADIKRELIKSQVTEIIHSAGCVEYFNSAALEKVNVEMTQKLLDLAQTLQLDRFIYISTIYSSGYKNTRIEETLHDTPSADPTEYTRSKRNAEWLVANSNLQSLIIRPSIVIGNSKSGRYSGKRYGLYQHWMGLERLMCDHFHEEMHLVASDQPVNFLHQDSFQNGFIGAYKYLWASTKIIHLASDINTAPSMRSIWDLWLDKVARPHKVFYYTKLDNVPLNAIHKRQRAYLMFASINLEIAAHYWEFSTDNMNILRESGVEFVNATLESVGLCQDRFVKSSHKIQEFMIKNKHKMCEHSKITKIGNPVLSQIA